MASLTTTAIAARLPNKHVAKLRDIADQRSTTVSRAVADIIASALDRDIEPASPAASGGAAR